MAQAAVHIVFPEKTHRLPVHDLLVEPAEEARRPLRDGTRACAEARCSAMKHSEHRFADDGDVPNNRLPLIVYAEAIDAGRGDPAVAFEDLFAGNGWGGGWRNGIFPFHHYHSTAHEVLGIARGEADVRFGGERGETVHVKAGDAVLIPAGVGHKRLSSSHDLLVIGAYPAGQMGRSHARGRRGQGRHPSPRRRRAAARDRPDRRRGRADARELE